MSIIKIHSRILYDSNIYLVKGNSAILIDAGTGLDSLNVIQSIQDNLGEVSLSAIILTHCHIDHAGGGFDISEHFDCPVYISSIDLPFVNDPQSDKLDVSVSKAFHIPLKPMVAQSLDDLVFDIGDHKLSVISTPGHTAGSISLYDEKTRSLFSGDTVFNPGFGRTDLPSGSYKALFESLHVLSNVNIGNLYPGHGSVAADGNKAVAEAIAMMEGTY